MLRKSQTEIFQGKQMRLKGSKIKEEEDRRQMKNAKKREETKERNYDKNFYVIDCETNGFDHNEPVQIAVLLFENGERKGRNMTYFIPENDFTIEARELT